MIIVFLVSEKILNRIISVKLQVSIDVKFSDEITEEMQSVIKEV